MEFKKTIAALAITASSAFALTAPPQETKVVCLTVHEDAKGVMYSGNCDESRNNKQEKLEILANGCAAEQISIRSTSFNGKFNVQISSCLPPNVVQL